MFKITKNGVFFSHKCVQCGLAITYNEYGNGCCCHCQAAQRMRADEGKTSAPVRFIMDLTEFWRITYHMKETNIPEER